jgi:hypothetical protein
MAERETTIGERYSPEKNLKLFSDTRIGAWILLSAALHVVVILLLSYTYVRSWLDPEWGRARAAALEKAEATRIKSEADLQSGKSIQEQRAAAQKAAAATNAAGTNATATGTATNAPALTAAQALEKRIAKAFARHGIDPTNPVVLRQLKDVPRERWASDEILESVKVAKPEDVPAVPRAEIGISLEDTK